MAGQANITKDDHNKGSRSSFLFVLSTFNSILFYYYYLIISSTDNFCKHNYASVNINNNVIIIMKKVVRDVDDSIEIQKWSSFCFRILFGNGNFFWFLYNASSIYPLISSDYFSPDHNLQHQMFMKIVHMELKPRYRRKNRSITKINRIPVSA